MYFGPEYYRNQQKSEIIHTAVRGGDLDDLRSVIDKYDVNQLDSDGNRPIHIAVTLDKSDILKLLLEKKADPNLKNSQNETAYDLAVKLGKEEMKTILQQYGGLPSQHLHSNRGCTIF
jgi:ankyrin repeat protein